MTNYYTDRKLLYVKQMYINNEINHTKSFEIFT